MQTQSDMQAPDTFGPPQDWSQVGRDGALYRKFEFEEYAVTSSFLEKLADLSEETGLYPDLSFASRHVNVTVPALAEGGAQQFAASASAIYSGLAE